MARVALVEPHAPVLARAPVAPWSEIAKGLAEPPICITLFPRH